MAIRNEAFIDLEMSMTNRIVGAINKTYAPLIRQAGNLAIEGKYTEAHNLVDTINLEPVIESQRSYIELVSMQALLFGVKDFTSPSKSIYAQEGPPEELYKAVDGIIHIMGTQGTEEMKKAAHTALEEEEVAQLEVQQQVQKATKKSFVREFVSSVNEANEVSINIGSSLHTSRLANWGFTTEAKVFDVTSYVVSEQLDGRTCPVCLTMHGKVFPVDSAHNKLENWLQVEDTASLKSIATFPKQSKAGIQELRELSDEEIIAKGWDTPPYHPRCRGILRRTTKTSPLIAQSPIQPPKPKPGGPLTKRQIEKKEFDLAKVKLIPGLGYKTQNAALNQYSDKLGVDPQEFIDAYAKGRVVNSAGFRVGRDKAVLDMQLDNGVDLVREFDFEPDRIIANHNTFQIPNELQGSPIVKEVLRDSVNLYDRLGIGTISLVAGFNLGSYAFAKYGAVPKENEWQLLKEEISGNLDNLTENGLPDETRVAIERILASNNPKNIRLLSDIQQKFKGQKLGKTLLLNKNWEGEIDLNDPDTRQRLEAYLGES